MSQTFYTEATRRWRVIVQPWVGRKRGSRRAEQGVVSAHTAGMRHRAAASAHPGVICCKCEIDTANISNPFRQCNYESAPQINTTGFYTACNFTPYSHKTQDSVVAIKKTSCDPPLLRLHHDSTRTAAFSLQSFPSHKHNHESVSESDAS